MKDATTEKLLATLKRHNPHRVRVFNGDDDSRDVAVPTRRRRWSSVISAIDARTWTRCVMLDKSGAELGYCENEGGARDIEELSPSFAGIGGQLMLGERIAALCMRSVKEAIASRDEEMKALLSAQGAVVHEMAQAVKSLGEVYRDMSAAEQEAADARVVAASEASSGSEMRQLMEALPVIMQALPVLKSLIAGPAEVVTPNGTRRG